ncbi:hypothetical protein D5086_019556 [Populus alba]|uniref:Uncharacterized protein n=1 Tax=Populus alba TaxID=43335 RepID=A0ACC4BHL0_POPAL
MRETPSITCQTSIDDHLNHTRTPLGIALDPYLSRKLAGSSSPVNGSGGANWFPASPTIGSKISRASRVSLATVRGDENDVEELEMLLEAYFMQIDSTLNKLTTLREYIDDTEDYINIQLDNHRNQLIQLELFLSSGTACLSIYSLVAGIFGGGNCHRSILCISVPSSNGICSLQGPGWILKGPMFSAGLVRDS